MEEDNQFDRELESESELNRLWPFNDIMNMLMKDKYRIHTKSRWKSSAPAIDLFLESIEEGTHNIDVGSFGDDDDSCFAVRDRPEEPSKTRLIDKASLLLGDTKDIGDFRSFQELEFCDQVHYHVMKKFRYLLRSQMCIPIMLNRRDMILIGPNGSRKTSGYLIALASIVLSYRTNSLQPQSVIIAPNFLRMNHLSATINKIFCGMLRVVISVGDSEGSNNVQEINNGCNIVITSPPCFLRLYGETITGENLINITLDSASELFSLFPNKMEEIFRKTYNQDRQYMIISSKYHPEFKNLMSHKLKNPVFCSISFMESALYAEVKSSLILTENFWKMSQLTRLLEENKESKIVVVCAHYREVEKIILDMNTSALYVHEKSNLLYVEKIAKTWASRKLLICSDYVLCELQISNADILIHYSMPKLLSDFSHRYIVLKDRFIEKIKNNEAGSNCLSFILVDEEALLMLPQLYRYASYYKDHNMPKTYEKVAKDVLEVRESLKNSNICHNILKYGLCRTFQCTYRHIIYEYKHFDVIPAYNYISFVITCIHDLSHYSARIVGYSNMDVLNRNLESKFIPFPSDFIKLCMEMMDYFKDRTKRMVCLHPIVGELVMVQKEVDLLFMRGKIKSVVYGKDNFIDKYIVKLIDLGEVLSLSPTSIFYLPLRFRNLPPQVVNIFISNVCPLDQDSTWAPAGTLALRKEYDAIKDEDLKMVSVGKVRKVFGRNIIIDDWLIHNIEDSYAHKMFSAREFIITNKFGTLNDIHIDNLQSLSLPDPLLRSSPPINFNTDLFF